MKPEQDNDKSELNIIQLLDELRTMAQLGTWGDEMTLTAAAQVFACHVHVLTSQQENYYLCYKPNDDNDEEAANQTNGDGACSNVFLAYISPIHYNSVVLSAGKKNK